MPTKVIKLIPIIFILIGNTIYSNNSNHSLQINNMNNADKFKLNNKFKFNAQSKRSIVPIILPSNFKINRLKSKNKIL